MDITQGQVNNVRVLPRDYVQSVDELSPNDFLKIYLETLRYQDPFNQTDISKSLDDMLKIHQIKYFSNMEEFLNKLQTWMNQITFLNTANLLGKEFVFKTDVIDTISRDKYYILSDGDYENVTLRIYDGDTVIREVNLNLSRGLNEIDLSDLPEGQYSYEILKDGVPLNNVVLGFKDRVKAVGIINGELILELESGIDVPSDKIVYVGG